MKKSVFAINYIIVIIMTITNHHQLIIMVTILISTHHQERDNFQTAAKRPMLCPSPIMAQSYLQWQLVAQLGVLCLVRYNSSNHMRRG